MPDIELSTHAKDMLKKRNLLEEWAWRTIATPDSRKKHADDGNMHYGKSHRDGVLRPPLWKNKMRLRVDRGNDALYFRLDETEIVESEEVQPGVILDFDKDGRVVGMEMLDISTRTKPETLRVLQFETA
jgi:uncharacterized protein YuzE